MEDNILFESNSVIDTDDYKKVNRLFVGKLISLNYIMGAISAVLGILFLILSFCTDFTIGLPLSIFMILMCLINIFAATSVLLKTRKAEDSYKKIVYNYSFYEDKVVINYEKSTGNGTSIESYISFVFFVKYNQYLLLKLANNTFYIIKEEEKLNDIYEFLKTKIKEEKKVK